MNTKTHRFGGFFYFYPMKHLFALFEDCEGVCTDTRTLTPNCLFICLSGANFDGNSFAQQALQSGAKYVIADNPAVCDEKAIFCVDNTLVFLQQLANWHRNKFTIPIIGITGSNGKTSTKELIHCVLSQKFNTLATAGNLNNHIGVPLTLLRLNTSHEIAIIEMGANRFKDIEELCAIAEPTHGIITNIGKAHLEGFLNFDGVLRTKRELYEAVAKVNGVLFYNADDNILHDNIPAQVQTRNYGTHSDAGIQGELIELTPFVNLKWKNGSYESEAIETQMIGKYNFYNFLAAICIGDFFGVPAAQISKAIAGYAPSNNRSQVSKTTRNTLILDAYNANPTSMKSAIESFAQINQEGKLAILGDMFELGAESASEHEHIVQLVSQLKFTCYFVGSRFFEAKKDENSHIQFFKTKEDVKIQLQKNRPNGQLILLKGSRGVGLEDLVEIL